jgi:hypothetical protein
MMSEMVVDWMQGEVPARNAEKAVRLLCVNGSGLIPHALLGDIVREGIEVIGITDSLDDALRHAIMASPDIILVPYVGDQVLEFLRAIEHMRDSSFSPYIVLVAEQDHGAVLERCEGFYRISVLPSSRVPRQLIPHLLRIADQVAPDA